MAVAHIYTVAFEGIEARGRGDHLQNSPSALRMFRLFTPDSNTGSAPLGRPKSPFPVLIVAV